MTTTTGYRYLFGQFKYSSNLLDDEMIVAELPLTGVTFTRELNSIGTFEGHLLLSGASVNYNALDGTTPGKTTLYVERSWIDNDGIPQTAIVWGGMVFSRTYNSAEQTLHITAREFEAYLDRRAVSKDLIYGPADPLFIAQDIVNLSQGTSYSNGSIGIQVGSETSGVLLYRSYHPYELKSVYQCLQDLARSESYGFDFEILCEYDPLGVYSTGISKTLKLYYPRAGTIIDPEAPTSSDLIWQFPANMVEYELSQDGEKTGNVVWALGGGSNEEQLRLKAYDPTKWDETPYGWPRLEELTHFSDVYTVDYLQKLALGVINAVSTPPTSLHIVVPAYLDPAFGSYNLGDDAWVQIRDDFFPNGMKSVYRITAMTVEPGEDGPERVTLTMTLPLATSGVLG